MAPLVPEALEPEGSVGTGFLCIGAWPSVFEGKEGLGSWYLLLDTRVYPGMNSLPPLVRALYHPYFTHSSCPAHLGAKQPLC